MAQEAQYLSGDDVNSVPPSTVPAGLHYNAGHEFRPRIARLRETGLKPPDWLWHPYTHASALLLSLMAAVGVVAFMVLSLEYTKSRGQLLLTALLVGGYFLTTLAATAMTKDGLMGAMRPLAFFAATVALLLLILGMWAGAGSDGFWKATAIFVVLSMGLVCAGNALARTTTGGLPAALAAGSAALSSLLTVMGAAGIAMGLRLSLYWWLFVLLVMVWLILTAAIPIAAYIQHRSGAGNPDSG